MRRRHEHSRWIERRRLLAGGWSWIKLALLGAVCYPFFRFLAFRLPTPPLRVEVKKSLKSGQFSAERDFILFREEAAVWAVSRTCTHLGCRLNFNEVEGRLICPCHQSQFAKSGERLAGPARRDLTRYPVETAVSDGQPSYVVVL